MMHSGGWREEPHGHCDFWAWVMAWQIDVLRSDFPLVCKCVHSACWSQRNQEMQHNLHTQMCDPREMAEAGEVTQRVLIKEKAPCFSNCQGGLMPSKPSHLMIWRHDERLLIFLIKEPFNGKLRLIISFERLFFIGSATNIAVYCASEATKWGLEVPNATSLFTPVG